MAPATIAGLAGQRVTTVVYMGVATAAALQAGLSGRLDAATLVAIVQHATLPNQRHEVCRLDALAATIASGQLASPAVIIIGDVVRAAAHLRDRESLDNDSSLRDAELPRGSGRAAWHAPCGNPGVVRTSRRRPTQDRTMDYLKPTEVIATMIEAGTRKGALSVRDLLVRGALSGGILGIATTLAITAAVQTSVPLVGAIIFPVGFVMIVLLGLELVTGSFALLPIAQMDGRITFAATLRNWGWSFLGNLLGSMLFAVLAWGALTMFGETPGGPVGDRIAAIADAKTLGYAAHGGAGWAAAFVKAMLCNWMVCMGVVMGMVAQSTVSKIVAAWLPITIFFGLGYEHAVVNMFVVPAGMLFGAKTTVGAWWLWNQVPVTLGNLVGGFVFTGLALYVTYGVRDKRSEPVLEGTPAHS